MAPRAMWMGQPPSYDTWTPLDAASRCDELCAAGGWCGDFARWMVARSLAARSRVAFFLQFVWEIHKIVSYLFVGLISASLGNWMNSTQFYDSRRLEAKPCQAEFWLLMLATPLLIQATYDRKDWTLGLGAQQRLSNIRNPFWTPFDHSQNGAKWVQICVKRK